MDPFVVFLLVESSEWQRQNAEVVLTGRHGTLSSRDYPTQVMTSESESKDWVLRAPIGERLLVTWSASLANGSYFDVSPVFPYQPVLNSVQSDINY